nr:hypothetical protein [Mesorhizobium xinjiangense]
MKKLLSSVMVSTLAAAFAMPLNAAPISLPKPEQVETSDVVKVHKRKWRRKHYRSHRHSNRRYVRRDCRYYGGCYRRHYVPRYYAPRYHYPRYYRRSGVTIYFSF